MACSFGLIHNKYNVCRMLNGCYLMATIVKLEPRRSIELSLPFYSSCIFDALAVDYKLLKLYGQRILPCHTVRHAVALLVIPSF